MKLLEISQRADSWDDLPFNKAVGSNFHEDDTVPKRTNKGDFIFYHGTSLSNAKKIMSELKIKRDDLGYSGVGTSKYGVSVYSTLAAMKANRASNTHYRDPQAEKAVILRVIIDSDWFAKHPESVNREVGGSGRDQFLIRPSRGEDGVPLLSAELVRVAGEDL